MTREAVAILEKELAASAPVTTDEIDRAVDEGRE